MKKRLGLVLGSSLWVLLSIGCGGANGTKGCDGATCDAGGAGHVDGQVVPSGRGDPDTGLVLADADAKSDLRRFDTVVLREVGMAEPDTAVDLVGPLDVSPEDAAITLIPDADQGLDTGAGARGDALFDGAGGAGVDVGRAPSDVVGDGPTDSAAATPFGNEPFYGDPPRITPRKYDAGRDLRPLLDLVPAPDLMPAADADLSNDALGDTHSDLGTSPDLGSPEDAESPDSASGACQVNPCQHGGVCREGAAGVTCQCSDGYTGEQCEQDVNECEQDNGGCAQNCANLPGTFQCSCGERYALNADGKACDLVNSLPEASSFTATGNEDSSIEIQLAASDADGDILHFVIDSANLGSAPCEGRLYQFGKVEITASGTVVTDARNRVIYSPAPNCNSDGKPAGLMVSPSLTYHAFEVTGPALASSAPATVSIQVSAINDRPSVFPSGAFSGDKCWNNCGFEEDFGHPVGVGYSPAVIYGGGADVEGDGLTITVVDVSCPTGTLTDLDGNVVGVGSLVSVPSGDLEALFHFKPLADESGNPYCVVTYKVSDGELEGIDTSTITISVASVNDAPRIATSRVVASEDVPTLFNLGEGDLDSAFFTGTITCFGVGLLEYQESPGDLWRTLDCNGLATSPVVLRNGPSESSFYGPWSMRYTPPTNQNGDGLMSFQMTLDDGVRPLSVANDYFVLIDVVPVNDGPLISAFDQPLVSTFSYDLQTEPNSLITPSVAIDDLDANSAFMFVSMSTTMGTLSLTIPPEIKDSVMAYSEKPDGTEVSFQAPLAVAQQVLRTLIFSSVEAGKTSVIITVSDQGATGACLLPDGTPDRMYCPLSAQATLNIEVIDPPSL